MKIAISINTTWNVINFRSGLIKSLLADGHEIVVISPADGFEKDAISLGCRHIDISMQNHGTSPTGDLKLLLRYLKILKKERPDAFLGYTIKPNIYGSLACNILGIPAINNISGLGTAFIRQNLLTKIVRGLYRIALRRSAHVFFQNDNDRDMFKSYGLVDAEKTSLLPGSGIDLKKFKPIGPGDDKTKTTFLMIARLLWDKGVREFIEAARKTKQKYPDTEFQLLGFVDEQNPNGVKKSELDAWIAEGVVTYLGSSNDVRDQIAPASCVVLPSYREGTPRTLLEAAAMQKPLIATDVPGCREVVVDGSNGYLCTVQDSDSLSMAFNKFIDLSQDQKTQMAKASRQLAEQKFDEQLVTKAYKSVLSALR